MTPIKRKNIQTYELSKKQKEQTALEKKLSSLRIEINKLTFMKSHYSIRNVKRREERNFAKRTSLRKEKNKYAEESRKQREEIVGLKMELKKTTATVRSMTSACQRHMETIRTLRKDKLSAMKKAIYHQQRNKRGKSLDKKGLYDEVIEREVETKKEDGQYCEKMPFCVMELAGLEVATGKIAAVVETVGNLCDTTFSHLPSRMACQRIVDEGHIIAKAFIKERVLKRSKSFGLHKDGTTRKKVKILDTSIRTDSGESFCLGWSSVASETGQAIADEAKQKLEELSASGGEQGMRELLEKMVYLMNDRAANEKKSSRLFEEWREAALKQHGQTDINKLQHLFCTAHVLLGFHSYVLGELKSMFDSSDFRHPLTVVLNDASDVFGSVGDHRGLRMHWNGYCLERGITSTIKKYKDNRFNGLFEVAAQVFHHHDDFLHILTSLNSPNCKQANLIKNLQNPEIILILECLSIFFHKITGPFWSMVICNSTSFYSLSKKLKDLELSLQITIENPNFILEPNSFSFLSYPTSSVETKKSLPTSIRPEMEEVIKKISKGMLTACQVQLADFLNGGKYEGEDAIKTVSESAPLTNLVCERNFGHLDASQKRRPNCSLHNHSSLMLLKQTRKKMREWFYSLSQGERGELWRRAKKEGIEMRKKHRAKDNKAVMDTFHSIKLKERQPKLGELKKGQEIAVACEDAWYFGE